ncbi:MAG TPA: sigma-70 family RNA polymerase sigma factor [Caldisericia bacterium]|nr:sigma-70 family RNA polymerase sigma factor [Caldisericia bacterium]
MIQTFIILIYMIDEKSVIEKIKKGDIDSYSILINEYQNDIYSLCLSIVKNVDDALDLTQEAFLIAYENIKNFKQEAKFSTWVYRIAYNLCVNFIKRKGEIFTLEDEDIINVEIEDKTSSIWEEIEKDERVKMISEGLKRIKDSDSLIIELKDIKGLTYEEISTILSIPMGTVKSRLYRARENLKKVVEDIIKKGDFEK